MPNGRKGRYQIRVHIAEVLRGSDEALSAEQIASRLSSLKNKKGRSRRRVGYSPNSISQLLRGAKGIDNSTESKGKEFSYSKVKTFRVTDDEQFTHWVESKKRVK
tara:strand:- start:421 stop:735 length:315 start_codon:yes stop_codon:yes gene_type:complete